MGVIGHERRAVGAGPPRCGKSLPAPPGRALGSAGIRGTRRWDPGWAGTQALPFLLAEFLLEAPVRGALLTMPEGVDWLSGTFCTMSLGPPSGTSFLALVRFLSAPSISSDSCLRSRGRLTRRD